MEQFGRKRYPTKENRAGEIQMLYNFLFWTLSIGFFAFPYILEKSSKGDCGYENDEKKRGNA